MGISGHGSDGGRQRLRGAEGEDRISRVLLVLDDVIAMLELVAGGDSDRAVPARERVDQLREIRRELRPREMDPRDMDYGRGEWASDLCWLLDQQPLADLYMAAHTSRP
jgi:hypothetical protein